MQKNSSKIWTQVISFDDRYTASTYIEVWSKVTHTHTHTHIYIHIYSKFSLSIKLSTFHHLISRFVFQLNLTIFYSIIFFLVYVLYFNFPFFLFTFTLAYHTVIDALSLSLSLYYFSSNQLPTPVTLLAVCPSACRFCLYLVSHLSNLNGTMSAPPILARPLFLNFYYIFLIHSSLNKWNCLILSDK